jgi:hypothetical protein
MGIASGWRWAASARNLSLDRVLASQWTVCAVHLAGVATSLRSSERARAALEFRPPGIPA